MNTYLLRILRIQCNIMLLYLHVIPKYTNSLNAIVLIYMNTNSVFEQKDEHVCCYANVFIEKLVGPNLF